MKQSIFNFAIVIGCLGALVACNSERNADKARQGVQEDLSVAYALDRTCDRVESIESDGDPTTPDVINHLTDEKLQELQNALNKSSNYELVVDEDEENNQFIIDLAINVAEGNNIHIVQSKEDFMNNSSVNVESIELQWANGTPNGEGTVELTGQKVDEESITLDFNINDDNSCNDTLVITRS